MFDEPVVIHCYVTQNAMVADDNINMLGEFCHRMVRNGLAAVDATTGAPSGWNPDLNDFATKILVDGSTVWVGGTFQRVGAKARTYFAAMDATTGIAR